MKKSVPEDQEPRGHNTRMPRGKGLIGIRAFRRLRRENPTLEHDEVWALAGYGPHERALDASQAPWADGRAAPAQARIRNDPRPDR